MPFRFEKLEIWNLAREFAVDIYRITRSFPKDEIFGLTAQIRRAANSVLLNIAEGSGRRSDADFRRFLIMSVTSLEESVTGLYIALDQKFISQKDFDYLYKEANKLASKINAFINTLNI